MGRRSFWRRQRHREDELSQVEAKLYHQLMEDDQILAFQVQEPLESITEGEELSAAMPHLSLLVLLFLFPLMFRILFLCPSLCMCI